MYTELTKNHSAQVSENNYFSFFVYSLGDKDYERIMNDMMKFVTSKSKIVFGIHFPT